MGRNTTIPVHTPIGFMAAGAQTPAGNTIPAVRAPSPYRLKGASYTEALYSREIQLSWNRLTREGLGQMKTYGNMSITDAVAASNPKATLDAYIKYVPLGKMYEHLRKIRLDSIEEIRLEDELLKKQSRKFDFLLSGSSSRSRKLSF